jgi:hypothetical protein
LYVGDILVRNKSKKVNAAVAARLKQICDNENLIIKFLGNMKLF